MDQSTHIISNFIAEHFFWVFLAVFFLNLLQKRRHERAQRKRFATLYLGSAVFLIYVAGLSIVEFGLTDIWLLPVVLIVGGVLYRYREHTFPFTLYCRETGQRLTWDEILYEDSNLSAEARRRHEEEQGSEQHDESPREEEQDGP
ncbi:MAG: hypothetical protein ACLFQZ_00095 [Spirochaetaceae bacterium]